MNKSKKLLFTLTFAASLTGCASMERDFSSTPTVELCSQYMTLPSYNLWHGARARELARRGESCGNPSAVAAARSQTDQAHTSFIQGTLLAPPPAPPGGYMQGTHNYILNGKPYTCTTFGVSTDCQ